ASPSPRARVLVTTTTRTESSAEAHSRMRARTASMRRMQSDSDARELFDRRETGGHLGEPVVPQRLHAGVHRRAFDLLTRRMARRERREILGHLEQLVDADPAAVAGLVAARAAALAVED